MPFPPFFGNYLSTGTISCQHTTSQPFTVLLAQWRYSVLEIYVAPWFPCTYMQFLGNIWIIMNYAAAGKAALVLNDTY